MNKGDFMYEKKTINKKYIILIAVFVVALVLGITNAIITIKHPFFPFGFYRGIRSSPIIAMQKQGTNWNIFTSVPKQMRHCTH